MKIKISEAINYLNVYISISQQICPITTSIKLITNANQSKKIIENYNNKIKELIEIYGEYSEDLEQFVLKKENEDLYNSKINELLFSEQEVFFERLCLDELKTLSLSIKEVEALLPFIEQ